MNLSAHPFLAGLAPAQIAALAAHAREAAFAPGSFLLREGDAADSSFLIIAGRVGLEIRTPTRSFQIASAGAGEVVGWSWLAAPARWHFDARASDDVAAIVLDGATLREACERDPALGFALSKRFLGVVTNRLEAVRLQLIDVYGAPGAELPWA